MQTSTRNARNVILTSPDSPNLIIPDWDESARRNVTLEKLRLLWAKREFLWRWLLIGLFASALIAFLIPAGYTTSAQLMPPDPQTGAGLALLATITGGQNGGGGLTSMASDLLGVKTSGSLFISVLRSRTVQDRIVNAFNLKSVYWKGTQEGARKRLGNNTDLTEDRKSGVITIHVSDHDPKRAAAIAGAYIDQLNALMAELNTTAAHRERVFLEDRLQHVNADLENAEKNFSQFASKSAAIDITAQGKAMVEGSAQLQGELIAAESELEGLRQIYSDNNVRVRSTQARINELRSQIAKLGGKYEENPNTSDPAAATENSYPTLRQLPILGVPYADKYRQLKVNEVIFETLTKQYELAKVEEAKELPSVKVLDTPEIPERRSSPPRMLIMIGGTLCSVMLAGVWIVGRSRWDELDRGTPGMIFVNDVMGTIRAKFPTKDSGNGSGTNGSGHSENGTPKETDQ
jgi:capsule polysaccharide export protein KpsE/RkpR